MFDFEKLNVSKKWNTEKHITTYIALKDLYNYDRNATYKIDALYINTKSKYGDSPVIQSGEFGVNLPIHRLECIQNLINNSEAVKAINEGLCGFTVYEYSIGHMTYYSINFKNINSDTKITEMSDIDIPF